MVTQVVSASGPISQQTSRLNRRCRQTPSIRRITRCLAGDALKGGRCDEIDRGGVHSRRRDALIGNVTVVLPRAHNGPFRDSSGWSGQVTGCAWDSNDGITLERMSSSSHAPAASRAEATTLSKVISVRPSAKPDWLAVVMRMTATPSQWLMNASQRTSSTRRRDARRELLAEEPARQRGAVIDLVSFVVDAAERHHAQPPVSERQRLGPRGSGP